MNELGPDARAILDAANGGDDPSDADRARVRAGVLRKVGAVAAVTAATASTTTAAAATKAGVFGALSTLAKAAIVLSAVTVVAGGAYVARSRPTPVTIAPSAAPIEIVPAISSSVPVPSPIASASASVAPPPSVIAPKPAPAPKKLTVEDELVLLQRAQAAMGAGDPARALALLDEHEKKFPSGALAEEREGQRVLARCALGRPDAQSGAEKFLAAHPDAPVASRVRKVCGVP